VKTKSLNFRLLTKSISPQMKNRISGREKEEEETEDRGSPT
jgi:hypothetical protein